ncbi:MAG: GHKL domain-containing protein [Deltaproteobacteria bacterium]|nr:GHKL domain-containing protein [Deltaproteobacteria bacterium]
MQWFPKTIEKSRLKWLFVFRLVANSFLTLLIVLFFIKGQTPAILDSWIWAISLILSASYLLTLAHYFLWPKFFGPVGQIIIQMVCDIILAAPLLALTGGFDSTLNFYFLLVVINSAFLGGLKISFVAAALSTLTWAAILDLHYYGYLPGLPPLNETMFASDLALVILVNTGASYLVAVLGGHLSTQLDISKQALDTSQHSLDRLSELNENILHSIDTGLITADTEGKILSVNRAARKMLQIDSLRLLGARWLSFFPELEKHSLELNEHDFQQLLKNLRFKHLREIDKAELIIELSSLDLIDINNENWGQLLVFKDQTTFSQMEAEIKRSEHMAVVGRLAAGLAHEIRTPLASMTSSWHMLLTDSLKKEDRDRLMLIIGREMDRLEGLVEDFLSFAKPSGGRPRAIDLNRLIGEQLCLYESWTKNDLVIDFHSQEIPKVYFDYDQLCQVFCNLVQNALEASKPDRQTQLTINTSYQTDRANYVTLSITDNGEGINEENIKRIFEPFFTTKKKGTGLGLATVWSIINKGNGHISVRSTPNLLTTFTVLIPVTS